ncbi:uncharacterized protein (DUF2384 family) [Bradyrhizobium sp. LB1.3]
MLLNGLPSRALLHLVENLAFLRWDDSSAKAIGMSHRTYQRHASAGAKPLSPSKVGEHGSSRKSWRKQPPFSVPCRNLSNG